jgi:CDP-diacylglycerol--inositol 3-phosphatidyltransferase
MYATLVMGGGESHKKVDKSRSWILNLYYTNKVCFSVQSNFTLVELITSLP